MQLRTEKFSTHFSKAGFNVVESAAILMKFVVASRRAARALGGARPHPLIMLEPEPAPAIAVAVR